MHNKLVSPLLCLFAVITVLYGCSKAASPPLVGSAPPIEKSTSSAADSSDLAMPPPTLSSTAGSQALVNFDIAMAVQKEIKFPGEAVPLKFAITPEGGEPAKFEHMHTDTTRVRTAYRYAKITPMLADAFELIDDKHEECIQLMLHDSNETIFLIKPQRAGTFTLSAKIDIFADKSCTGEYQSKTARDLSVKVEVNHIGFIQPLLEKMWGEFSEQFLAFWALILTAIFAFLAYTVKKKLSTQSDS